MCILSRVNETREPFSAVGMTRLGLAALALPASSAASDLRHTAASGCSWRDGHSVRDDREPADQLFQLLGSIS